MDKKELRIGAERMIRCSSSTFYESSDCVKKSTVSGVLFLTALVISYFLSSSEYISGLWSTLAILSSWAILSESQSWNRKLQVPYSANQKLFRELIASLSETSSETHVKKCLAFQKSQARILVRIHIYLVSGIIPCIAYTLTYAYSYVYAANVSGMFEIIAAVTALIIVKTLFMTNDTVKIIEHANHIHKRLVSEK